MTISSTTRRAGPFSGNGVTTVFPFAFKVFEKSDITLLRYDQSGNSTALVLDSDYSVTLSDNQNASPGGTITCPIAGGTPITSAFKLLVLGAVPNDQQTDITNGGGFYPDVVEDMVDRSTIQIQQIVEKLGRALLVPPLEGATPELPPTAERLNTLLGFDANGNLTALPLTASVGAGDMRLDMFTAGVDYPSGTTSISLSRAPGNVGNIEVFFDGTFQGPDQIQSLVDKTLTFTAPIPDYVTHVYVRSGTTLSTFLPPHQSVTDDSVSPGTALYDRIANSFNLTDPRFVATDFTAQVQKALDYVGARGGGVVHVPDGVTGTLTRSVYFNYPNVILYGNSRNTNTFTAAANASGIDVQGMFKILAAKCGLVEIGIDGNIANNLGKVFGAVWSDGRDGTVVRDCFIRNCIGDGIFLYSSGNQNSNFVIRGNTVQNVGWGGITVFYGVSGKIVENGIVICGSSGIRTDGVDGNIGAGASFNVDITQNFVSRTTPPTGVRGGVPENGFMIVYGAGDAYISVQDNFCYDNRNAGEDGIGLGQDGTHHNVGCIVQGNIVAYAGLFGIDATTESTVVDNIILFSTQCGIKVGTDMGGNCTSCLIKDNLIYQPNNPTAHYPTVQDMGIHVDAGLTPAIYAGIRITGNKVVEPRSGGARLTNYGLVINFKTGVTYSNNDFSNNDFSEVVVAGVFTSGDPLPQETGWTYSSNRHPSNVKAVTGAVLNVFGYEKVSVGQAGATTITNILGGFDGCDLSVQHADGNSTWKFNSNSLMYGNNNANLTPAGGNWVKFERYNGVWGGYRTVQ